MTMKEGDIYYNEAFEAHPEIIIRHVNALFKIMQAHGPDAVYLVRQYPTLKIDTADDAWQPWLRATLQCRMILVAGGHPIRYDLTGPGEVMPLKIPDAPASANRLAYRMRRWIYRKGDHLHNAWVRAIRWCHDRRHDILEYIEEKWRR